MFSGVGPSKHCIQFAFARLVHNLLAQRAQQCPAKAIVTIRRRCGTKHLSMIEGINPATVTGLQIAQTTSLCKGSGTNSINLPTFHVILLAERNSILSGPDGELDLLTNSEGLVLNDQAALLHEQFVAVRQRGMNRRKLNLMRPQNG
jgi:hypothetical protein